MLSPCLNQYFKSLATLFSTIISAGVFFQLLACALSLAVHMVGLEISSIASSTFITSVCATAIIISSTFAYCYFSENVTNDLASIGESFYSSKWYQLPINQEKLFIMPIQRSQIEFRITGLGLVDCSLVIFTSVRVVLVSSLIILL